MKIFIYVRFAAIILLLSGCYKQKLEEPARATLYVVHAHAGGLPDNTLQFDFNNSHPVFKTATHLSWWEGSSLDSKGTRVLGISTDKPFHLSVFFARDTLKSIFSKTIPFAPADLYTLFVSGVGARVDTLLIKEAVLPAYTGDVCGIRFINLAPDAGDVSINLVGRPNGSEVAVLHYQQVTSFIQYPAGKDVSPYQFEVRQISTGNVLATYSFDDTNNRVPRSKNVMLMFRGSQSGDTWPEVAKVNYY